MDCFFLRLLPGDLEESALLDLSSCLQVDGAGCVRVRQHAQNGLDDVLYLLVRQPLLLAQHFLADESLLDVGVVDRSTELEEGELEGELFREVDIEDKLGALVWAGKRSIDEEFPVVEVFLESGYNSPKWEMKYCSFILSRTSANSFYSRFI